MDSPIILLFGDGTPWYDGLLGFCMYAVFGFFLAYKNARAIPIIIPFLLQWIIGTLLMRYGLSYMVFHHTLREGMWPIVWCVGAVIGIKIAVLVEARYAKRDQGA